MKRAFISALMLITFASIAQVVDFNSFVPYSKAREEAIFIITSKEPWLGSRELVVVYETENGTRHKTKIRKSVYDAFAAHAKRNLESLRNRNMNSGILPDFGKEKWRDKDFLRANKDDIIEITEEEWLSNGDVRVEYVIKEKNGYTRMGRAVIGFNTFQELKRIVRKNRSRSK